LWLDVCLDSKNEDHNESSDASAFSNTATSSVVSSKPTLKRIRCSSTPYDAA
jgi:hypothetical protein